MWVDCPGIASEALVASDAEYLSSNRQEYMATILEGDDYDLVVAQGAAFSEIFYSREDDEATVVPFPVGTTGRAQGRTSGKLQVTFTVVVDELAGTVTMSATPEQTDAITEGGRWDLFLDYPNIDLPTMFVRGKYIFKRKITTT